MPLSSSEIVKAAWKKSGLTQVKFAESCGATQYNLSRYVNNKVPPPESIIMHCMHILGIFEDGDVTADELASLISQKLGSPEQRAIRKAVYRLIESLA